LLFSQRKVFSIRSIVSARYVATVIVEPSEGTHSVLTSKGPECLRGGDYPKTKMEKAPKEKKADNPFRIPVVKTWSGSMPSAAGLA
jgi:hypothetical protein